MTVALHPPGALVGTLPESHPTTLAYLDESGVITADQFFGIGCLLVTDPAALSRELRDLRSERGFFEEMHWGNLDKAITRDGRAYEMAEAALDLFFATPYASFSCLVADRGRGSLVRRHGSAEKAYEHVAIELLSHLLEDPALMTVVADHVDTPRDVRFEDDVKTAVNERKERLAVTEVLRFDSDAADGLQLADVLLGAAMFDLRQGAARGRLNPASQKARLSAKLLSECGLASFRPDGRAFGEKLEVRFLGRRKAGRGRRGGDSA